MKTVAIDLSSRLPETYRAARVRSLFNVTPDQAATFRASVQIPVDEPDWQIGLIVGPSGSGKSTIGRAAFGPRCFRRSAAFSWAKDRPIIDEIATDSGFTAPSLSPRKIKQTPSVPPRKRPAYRRVPCGPFQTRST